MSHRMFGLLVACVLVLLITGVTQSQMRDLSDDSRAMRPVTTFPIDDDEGDDGFGFGKKIAGSWLGTGSFSVDLGCDGTFDIGPIPFTDAHAFEVGGAHVATNPANPNTGLGTWTKTGQRQASMRDINFGVDATPGGALTTISIITMVADFDEDFETATTHFGADVYLPTQDPLDPAEIPIACSDGVHDSLRKVSATE